MVLFILHHYTIFRPDLSKALISICLKLINFEDFKVFKVEPTVKTNRRPTDGQQKTDNVRKKTIQQKIDRRQAEDSVAMKIEESKIFARV